ncbi:protein FAM181A isoform X2 [Mauremys reevesii]|uniref:protein FAM181A isoform X2 n=1 Tax=Mauremys reevesii TaxID=260615 RepID=UPI00193F55F5|nr:protein FAM181A isoform X2 [Mauremys reevesii]
MQGTHLIVRGAQTVDYIKSKWFLVLSILKKAEVQQENIPPSINVSKLEQGENKAKFWKLNLERSQTGSPFSGQF